MAAPLNPHFSLPFRFVQLRSGRQVIPMTEEGSLDELGDCVELCLRTEQGQRRTISTFGRPQSLAFMSDPELARSIVQQTVDDNEPRVAPFVQAQEYDPDDPGVMRLLAMYAAEVETEQSEQEDYE